MPEIRPGTMPHEASQDGTKGFRKQKPFAGCFRADSFDPVTPRDSPFYALPPQVRCSGWA